MTTIALGNFDGVHLGHQQLIATAYKLAMTHGWTMTVVSFNPHPLSVLRPPHTRLMSIEAQIKKLNSLGCSRVEHLHFDQELRELSPQEFLEKVLLKKIGPMGAIVVGYNFRFGKDRLGTPGFLSQWGHDHGVKVIIEPEFTFQNQKISTSIVRRAVLEGEMERAAQMLGHFFELKGRVVKGDQRGRKIGFPTLNIEDTTTQVPGPGVYATLVEIDGKNYPSVTHVGELPTFHISTPRVETHVLNFDQDLYGKWVKLSFVKKVRSVQKFSNATELKNQIEKDINEAQLCLK